jgi:adenosine deaminase
VPPVLNLFLRRCLLFALLTALATAQNSEQRTARYLDSVRKQPPLLLAFLRDLPKGGDLHNHLDGAIYAEDLVDFAADGNCAWTGRLRG